MTHLMVCDDEADICALVGEVGRQLGYTVSQVPRSTDFNAAYILQKPDIVVLDIVMPERDGIEIVLWLANQGYDGRVLLVSGYDPQHAHNALLLAQCRGLDIVTTLRKPVPLRLLREALAA
ncbi:MAG: response regulator [Ferrovibrio sp.]|nr:response regulator [Ferrovibrio sp.]